MTPWIVAHQAPLSMGFPRQEYWSGLPFPSPGDFPDLGIKRWSPALQADSLPTERLNFYEYLVLRNIDSVPFFVFIKISTSVVQDLGIPWWSSG